MTRIFLITACLLAGIATYARAADSDGTRPDDALTPGEIRTTERSEICGHSTREFRNVSVTTKVAVRRAYGITPKDRKWCAEADGCEVDHRVPLTVGGANKPGSIRNLWPERSDGPFGFHVKDKCEASLGRAICAGRITVADAQAVFLGDWTVGCRPWVPELRAGAQ